MRYFCFNRDSKIHYRWAGKGEIADHNHITRTLDECECFIVTEGELYLEQGGTQFTVSAGDYFISEPNIKYGGFRPSTAVFCWLHFFYGDGEATFTDEPDKTYDFCMPKFGHLDRTDSLIIMHVLIKQYCLLAGKADVIEALTTAFLRDLCALSSAKESVACKDRHFQPILEYLNFSPRFQEITDVKSMAEMFGYNEKYMIRMFKKNTGMTPLQYLTVRKLVRAQEMLGDSNMTIQAIAASLHYDYYYFLRLFRRYIGMTPTEYRKTIIPDLNKYIPDDYN